MKKISLALAILTSFSSIASVPGVFWRTDSDLTSWNNLVSAGQITAEQIKTSTEMVDFDGTVDNYLAPGSYNPAFLSVSAKLIGGFSGIETTLDLNARVLTDQDGNGIVEPWEFENVASLSSSQANSSFSGTGTNVNRILTVTGNGAEVNGVTINDFHYSSYSGAISLGVPAGSPSAANNTSAKAGILKNSIVRKVKNTPLSSTHIGGVVMLTNQHSIIDHCLIEENVSVANNSGGPVFMNLFGGKITGSVIRNNASAGTGGRGGGVYASTSAATGDLNAIIENCIIHNNSASNGGGLRVDAQSGRRGLQIVNTTIVNNKTTSNTATVELIHSGLIANSIVVNTTLEEGGTEIRCHAANHFFSNTIYGDSTYVTGGYKSGNSAGKITSDIHFVAPTTFTGIMIPDYTTPFVQASYNEIKQANFKIAPAHLTTSPATTLESLKSLPATYTYSGGANPVVITGSIPAVDLLGTERPLLNEQHLDLGAYQQSSLSTAVKPNQKEKSYCISKNQQLTISNAYGLNINVFSISGQLVQSLKSNTETISIKMEKGIYIVRSEKFTEKIIVQ